MRLFSKLITILALSTVANAQETTSDQNVAPQVEYADLIIWGGPIYTADDSAPNAEAIAIQNGRFIHVGSRSAAEALSGPDTIVHSLNGSALFPGFVDAHVHLSGIGARELTLNLEGHLSLVSFKSAVSSWLEDHPAKTLIVGRGWIETHWPEKRFPSRWDLDDISKDIPIILTRSDGHAVVANTKAFELAQIDRNTVAPFGGEILKNALGETTGMLVDNAMALVRKLIPEQTAEDLILQLKTGGALYTSIGWTGVHNMSTTWPAMEAIEALSDSDDLKLRVYNSIGEEYADLLFASGRRSNQNGKALTRAIKMRMDGALGSRGAALIESYSDADTIGLILSHKEDSMPIFIEALEKGMQINTHAIGDRANRLMLDWYEEAMNQVPASNRDIEEPRWRDEHTQIVTAEDIQRYRELGVIPSMQPSHAIGDLHFAPARLGDKRLEGAYAWSTLIASGVIIAGGSDAPVERGEPLIEFYAATARRDLNGYQGENWHPEEALTREEALKMFTLWPAIASFQEKELGSITVGKQADLTAFDIDLMTVVESDIPKGKAVLTVIAGEIVHRAE